VWKATREVGRERLASGRLILTKAGIDGIKGVPRRWQGRCFFAAMK